jgi:hypothetical protein
MCCSWLGKVVKKLLLPCMMLSVCSVWLLLVEEMEIKVVNLKG